jgi:zinc/manganese transport system substrate-binding protein
MPLKTRLLLAPALVAGAALTLAGCASAAADPSQSAASDDAITIVTSTNVYSQIAEEIAGDAATITPVISSAAQDPHEYEATAADQLTVQKADLIIQNGGGYDAFMDSLIDASKSEAPVIVAAEYSDSWQGTEATEHDTDELEASPHSELEHDHDHIEGFNEHVWYDPHTVEDLAKAIAEHLGELAPDHAADFAANADAFVQQIGGLEDSLGQIEAKDAGAKVFVTEPVPVYLIEAAGLVNATPNEFSESVEEGQDVPPATLLESLQLIDSGEIALMIVNPQTGGAETTQVMDEAKAKNIPVLEFTETLPEGQTYLSWMQSNISALSDALAA